MEYAGMLESCNAFIVSGASDRLDLVGIIRLVFECVLGFFLPIMHHFDDQQYTL